MTRDRDLDRVLETWLTDGPERMPDRLILAVTDRIARQRQRPVWRLPRRQPMRFSFAAIAAIAIVAVLAALMLQPLAVGRPAPTVAPGPSVAPSAAASATPAAIGCEDDLVGCAGPLAAGRYKTSSFSPLLEYTVPAGWTNVIDHAGVFKLDRDAGGSYLIAWSSPQIADECTPTPKPGLGRTAADIVAYLRSHPGIDASTPVHSTLDRLPVISIDVAVRPGWTKRCPDGVRTDVEFLVTAPGAWWYGVPPDSRMHLVLVDIPESRNAGSQGPGLVVFQVYGGLAQAEFATDTAAADAIIGSTTFGCGPLAGRPCTTVAPQGTASAAP